MGSESRLAQVFKTAANPEGYLLNSIRLLMGDAAGSPAGFGLSVYSSSSLAPTVSLTALGCADPLSAGVWGFSSSEFTLSPSTYYFSVVTAETPSSTGTFNWSTTEFSPTVDRWDIPNVARYLSPDGLDWTLLGRQDVFQMGSDATAVPEPSTVCLGLLGLAALALNGRARRRGRAGNTPTER